MLAVYGLVALVVLVSSASAVDLDAADPCLEYIGNQRISFGKTAPRYDGLALKNWVIKTPTQIQQCLGSIPFNSAEALDTVSVIQSYLELYPFLDTNRSAQVLFRCSCYMSVDVPTQSCPDSMSCNSSAIRNSGTPFNLSVHTDKDLASIADKIKAGEASGAAAFSSSFDFHNTIRETIRQARDGHFHYGMPRGFGLSFVLQPINLFALEDTNDSSVLRFYVKSDESLGVHDRFFGQAGSGSLSSYVGREVLEIDGVPTLDYLVGLARKYPMSKDDSLSFNFLLFHTFVYRGTLFPESDTIKFKFGNHYDGTVKPIEEVNVNYIVLDTNERMASRAAMNANNNMRVKCSSKSKRDKDEHGQTISVIQHNYHRERHEEWHETVPLHNSLKQRMFVEQLLQETAPEVDKRAVHAQSTLGYINAPSHLLFFRLWELLPARR